MVAVPANDDCGTQKTADETGEVPDHDDSRLGRQLLRKWSDKLAATRSNLESDAKRVGGPISVALGEAGFQLDDVLAHVDEARERFAPQ
ncbi:MAG: hypothetical protein V4653_10615 [Pseudomonadota bacterium]